MSTLQDTIKSLGPARLSILGIVFVALLMFFAFASTQVAKPSLSLLYSDLTSMDAGAIAAKLEESSITYQVSQDGTKVMVGKNDIGRARMLLAEAGLPNGGSMGYEIFDQQSSFGTTGFVQNINKQRALQGELARTISSLEPVHSATVNIVLPERQLFSRESTEATASVTLKLRPGQQLRKEQIVGIQNLVANSVPGLNNKSVTILDSQANILASGDEEEGGLLSGSGSLRAEELRLAHERRLKRAVEDILGSIVGRNKVRAQVRVDLDFDRVTTNSETFDPEGQVARSTQTLSEENIENEASREVVTVENNLPGLPDDAAGGSQPTAQNTREEETINFEISKTVQSIVRESGEINKLNVAVLVDGTYVTDEEGNRTYTARSEEEMDQIAALVRTAVGLDTDRGDTIEVINMPFAEVEVVEALDTTKLFGLEKTQLLDTVEMLMIVIACILVLLLLVKPIISHVLGMSLPKGDTAENVDPLIEAQNNPALAAPGAEGGMQMLGEAEVGGSIAAATGSASPNNNEALIDMQSVEGKVKESTVKRVGEIVTNHPNETVSVLRNWMSGE